MYTTICVLRSLLSSLHSGTEPIVVVVALVYVNDYERNSGNAWHYDNVVAVRWQVLFTTSAHVQVCINNLYVDRLLLLLSFRLFITFSSCGIFQFMLRVLLNTFVLDFCTIFFYNLLETTWIAGKFSGDKRVSLWGFTLVIHLRLLSRSFLYFHCIVNLT